MSKKTETKENYSNNTNEQNNDFNESVNRSLDETKDNIKKTIDESKSQIPRINNIVNSYQEQSLQTTKEISEEYIDSQKEVVNSLQSAWRPYNEIYNGLVTNFCTPDAAAKAYWGVVHRHMARCHRCDQHRRGGPRAGLSASHLASDGESRVYAELCTGGAAWVAGHHHWTAGRAGDGEPGALLAAVCGAGGPYWQVSGPGAGA